MQGEEVRLVKIGNYTFRLVRYPNGTYLSEPLIPPHQTPSIQLIPKEEKILGIFESYSNPGEKHYVIQSPQGTVYCTCLGFRSPNKCWHYRGMVELLKDKTLRNLRTPINLSSEETR